MAVDPNNYHSVNNASIAITLPSLTSSGLPATVYSRRSSSATSSYAPCDTDHSWNGFNCRTTSLARSISNNIHHGNKNPNSNSNSNPNPNANANANPNNPNMDVGASICRSTSKNLCTNSIHDKIVGGLLHGAAAISTNATCSNSGGGRYSGSNSGNSSLTDGSTGIGVPPTIPPAPPPPFPLIPTENSAKSDYCDNNPHKSNSIGTYINVSTAATPYVARDKVTPQDYT